MDTLKKSLLNQETLFTYLLAIYNDVVSQLNSPRDKSTDLKKIKNFSGVDDILHNLRQYFMIGCSELSADEISTLKVMNRRIKSYCTKKTQEKISFVEMQRLTSILKASFILDDEVNKLLFKQTLEFTRDTTRRNGQFSQGEKILPKQKCTMPNGDYTFFQPYMERASYHFEDEEAQIKLPRLIKSCRLYQYYLLDKLTSEYAVKQEIIDNWTAPNVYDRICLFNKPISESHPEEADFALLKLHAVNKMLYALENKQQLPHERLQGFNDILANKRKLLSVHRDRGVIAFLKSVGEIIAGAITLGMTVFFGTFKPEGHAVVDEMQKTLSQRPRAARAA